MRCSIMQAVVAKARLAQRLNDELQIDSARHVRQRPTSYIDGEGRRSVEAKKSLSLCQDATGLAGALASACLVSCEYGPRDSRPGIHFQVF